MNRYLIQTTGLILLLLFPITALAADAAAPTAPAVQREWFTADFIRTLFSVAVGGVISGIVALGLALMNNRNALKLNQQKIDADKERLELEFKFKKQEQDELTTRQQQSAFQKEREKQCKFLLDMFNPSKIIRESINIEKSTDFMTALLYAPGKPYSLYGQRIIEYTRFNPCAKQVALFFDNQKEFMTEEDVIFWAKLNVYYSSFVLATRKALHNEDIIPFEDAENFEQEIFELTYSEMKDKYCEPNDAKNNTN